MRHCVFPLEKADCQLHLALIVVSRRELAECSACTPERASLKENWIPHTIIWTMWYGNLVRSSASLVLPFNSPNIAPGSQPSIQSFVLRHLFSGISIQLHKVLLWAAANNEKPFPSNGLLFFWPVELIQWLWLSCAVFGSHIELRVRRHDDEQFSSEGHKKSEINLFWQSLKRRCWHSAFTWARGLLTHGWMQTVITGFPCNLPYQGRRRWLKVPCTICLWQ